MPAPHSVTLLGSPKPHPAPGSAPSAGRPTARGLASRRGACYLLGAVPLSLIVFIVLTGDGGKTPQFALPAVGTGGLGLNDQPPPLQPPQAERPPVGAGVLPDTLLLGGTTGGVQQAAGGTLQSGGDGAPPPVATLSMAPSPYPLPGALQGAQFKYDVVVVAIFRGETLYVRVAGDHVCL
jgi:hypothetical protein